MPTYLNDSLAVRRYGLALLLVALLGISLWLMTATVGNGGAQFDGIYDTIIGLMQGTAGRIITILAFIVGLIAAVAAQSLVGLVVGLGIGIFLFYAKDVTEAVVTATLPLL
jgi:conjugal transfer pilus assembly protein TraA